MTSKPSSVSDLFNLHGRLAIVTGAYGGIGLQIAVAYAEAGATVYCIDRVKQKDGDGWDKEMKRVHSNGEGRMKYRQGDVTDIKTMEEVVERIVKEEGKELLDICVACAGILRPDDSINSSSEKFMEILNTNVNGIFCTVKAAYNHMKQHHDRKWQKSIILIASMSGSVANKGMHWIAYNASKAAVVQMARSMACSKEFSDEGIRVNSISPGYIDTDMVKNFLEDKPDLRNMLREHNPMNKIGRPDEMRGVALWLAGDGSTFCTGSDIRVDGGHCAW